MSNNLSLVELIHKRREEGSLDLPVFDRVAHEVYQTVQADQSNAELQVVLEDAAELAA